MRDRTNWLTFERPGKELDWRGTKGVLAHACTAHDKSQVGRHWERALRTVVQSNDCCNKASFEEHDDCRLKKVGK